MPKSHHKYTYTYKPTYNSQATSSTNQTTRKDQNTPSSGENSVQERLARLRLQPQTGAPEDAESDLTTRYFAQASFATANTIPPNLQELLGSSTSFTAPRPRVPRGFAAPDSWRHAANRSQRAATINNVTRNLDRAGAIVAGKDYYNKYYLPGLSSYYADPLSLVHIVMRHIARHQDEFIDYQVWHLSTFLKSFLLDCVAIDDTGRAITWQMLRTIYLTVEDLAFAQDQDEDDTTTNSLTSSGNGFQFKDCSIHQASHLNLARAIGPSLSFKRLLSFFFRPLNSFRTTQTDSKTDVADAEKAEEGTMDWEQEEPSQPSPEYEASLQGRQFILELSPKLEYLSLAYPHPSTSHEDLLKFLEYVPTITHLSIAGWPSTPKLQLVHQWTVFTKRLSKMLLCLQYLDISDCDAVAYQSFEYVDWTSTWRKVSHLVLRQSPSTDIIDMEEQKRAALSLCTLIRENRKRVNGMWCSFNLG